MTFFICKLAILLAVAATGAAAHPLSNNIELSARASSIYIQDGDFSAPLQGNWNVSTERDIVPSDVTRLNSGVVQIKKASTCTKHPYSYGGRAYLSGTIHNVVPQQDFIITFQYRTLIDTILYESFGLGVNEAVREGKATFTQKVKANQWYTYTEHLKAAHKLDGSDITFSLVWDTCGADDWVPTAQFDNFQVTSP